MKNQKVKITYKEIVVIIMALILTGLSFMFFFLFNPLHIGWTIAICVIDIAFSMFIIFSNFFVKLTRLFDKNNKTIGYKGRVLFIVLYFILFYLISLIVIDSISWQYFASIFVNCVYFSFFAFPSFFLIIPILLLIGYGLGD